MKIKINSASSPRAGCCMNAADADAELQQCSDIELNVELKYARVNLVLPEDAATTPSFKLIEELNRALKANGAPAGTYVDAEICKLSTRMFDPEGDNVSLWFTVA